MGLLCIQTYHIDMNYVWQVRGEIRKSEIQKSFGKKLVYTLTNQKVKLADQQIMETQLGGLLTKHNCFHR